MSRSVKAGVVLLLLLVVVLSLLLFRDLLRGGTLMTSDDNIGHIAGYQDMLPGAFFSPSWMESPLAGHPALPAPLNWSNAWLALLPARAFANCFHALSLAAASLMLGLYLFRRGVGVTATLLGVTVAFWLGSNFTLIYAGHIRKFSILFLFSALLFCLDRLFSEKKWSWAVLSGFVLGVMFLEQQDMALFFGLFAGAYAVFLAWGSEERLRAFLRLWPVPLVALLMTAGVLQTAYRQSVAGVAPTEAGLEERWAFSTQWSWPPEESIDFIAPGFTGWRSGEPAGPYWGRMGRSPGWETSRQGFMNFKLENTYIGFLPLAFALFALVFSRRSARRAPILFWAAATVVALLLAFGKYFPLYRLFWRLPVIHTIRNPNKFLQVFQVGLGILTAYGADALFRRSGEKADRECSDARRFFWWVAGAGGLLILLALGATLGRQQVAGEFAGRGWPEELARLIAANRSTALSHAAGMAAVAAMVFAVFAFPRLRFVRARSGILGGLLVLLIAADAVVLSRHYVKTLPRGFIEENAVTRLLKEHLGRQRAALATQEAFYNIWLTYLFPYQGIPVFNFAQMPRMPVDYRRFLETVGREPLRMWRLSAAGLLLAPSGIRQQLPAGSYETMLRYNVVAPPDGGLQVRLDDNGDQAVFRSLAPAPRYTFIGGCERLDDEEALRRLASPEWPLFEKVILPPDCPLPRLEGRGPAGHVDVLEYRPGRVLLKVRADAPGYLRAADRYDPDWTGRVNGEAVDVLRADYLFLTVPLPAGEHHVELRYRPPRSLLLLQPAGLAAGLLAALSLFTRGKKGSRRDP